MPEPRFLINSTWHRGSYRYEGDWLVPEPGASSSYDPFEHYEQRPQQSPHIDLANLDTFDPVAIQGFVNTWGLLGLFQHRLVHVRYAEVDVGWIQVDPDPPRADGVEVIESPTRYLRCIYSEPDTIKDPVFHARHQERFDAGLDELEFAATDAAGTISAQVGRRAMQSWEDTTPLRGVAAVESMVEDNGYEDVPIHEYMNQYFPYLQEEERYPSLHSIHLWDHLAENVEEFGIEAAFYQMNFRAVHSDDLLEDVSDVQNRFVRNLRNVHPSPQYFVERGEPAWKWRTAFPSLLAACYQMLMMDMDLPENG